MQITTKDPTNIKILTVNPSVLRKNIEKIFKDHFTLDDFDSINAYNKYLKDMSAGKQDNIFRVIELLQDKQNYSDDKIEVNLNNITNIIKKVAKENLK